MAEALTRQDQIDLALALGRNWLGSRSKDALAQADHYFKAAATYEWMTRHDREQAIEDQVPDWVVETMVERVSQEAYDSLAFTMDDIAESVIERVMKEWNLGKLKAPEPPKRHASVNWDNLTAKDGKE